MLASMAGSKPAWMKSSNSWNIFTSPRWIRIALATVVVVPTCIFLGVETRAFDKIPLPSLISHKAAEPKEPPPIPAPPPYLEANVAGATDKLEKLAYVTFLTGNVAEGDDLFTPNADADDLEEDKYFQAIRILLWQFIHKPETRTKHDVIVMVTPTVSQARRDRLKKDGAIVHAVEFLHTVNDSWVQPEVHRWDDVMTKLRVWEMTQYDRIVVLDGDSMLLKNLDSVFDDPGAQLLATKPSNQTDLPSTYLLASNSEVWDSSHSFPPTHGTGLKGPGNMNAGFFILAPSLPVFEYYKSLLNTPGSFDPRYPEQNLINYAHRWDGPMPWREIAYTWNIRCPNDNDIAQGLTSLHEKWWTQPYIYNNDKTKQWLQSRRWEMKGCVGYHRTAHLCIVLFRMFDMRDVYGPSEVLQFIGESHQTNIVYIAETLEPVTMRPVMAAMNPLNSSVYPSLTPTHTFETVPDLYVLIIPGGQGWRNPTRLNATMTYIRETTPKVRQVLTVYAGSALAARAGILTGKTATMNKSSSPTTVAADPNATWVPSVRWVEDYPSSPPIWSSSGVTAGIDMMLHWVEQTYSADDATNIARFIEHVRITNSSIDPFARNETVSE